jgi:hypothetical protein
LRSLFLKTQPLPGGRTAVVTSGEKDIFSRKHAWFGDSILLVTHTQEFLSRVEGAAKKQHLRGQGKLVTYYNQETYSGQTGRFMKSSRYEHQQEYRLALETGLQGPFLFDVGDLTDVTSDILPFNEADQLLKFSTADATEAELTW